MQLDPVTAAMQRQKRYRELVPMPWEQYLDEPVDVIDWTLRIDEVEKREAERRASRSQ